MHNLKLFLRISWLVCSSPFIIFLFILFSCAKEEVKPSAQNNLQATRDNNLALGNPSNASNSVVNYDNYLIDRSQYSLSYNNSKHIPNWVSWHLSSAWKGSTPRQNNFSTDPALPSAMYAVSTSDYTNSGFDRGHMCPSDDRDASIDDNSATFFMTNIVPQAPKNNQVTWVDLENYCRTLISSGNELYIISGVYGQGGTGSSGSSNTISAHSILVPAYLWKIIIVLPTGENDISRIDKQTRVIAIYTPNNQTVSVQDWKYYRVNVDFIESKTGYNFLSNVPTDIQNVLEAQTDIQ